MATLKQRMAVDKIVENHGNVSRAMLEVGYPPVTAKNPKNLTESKGFKELMKEYGLTEGLIAKSLVEDIKLKKQNRIGELRLGSEILGMKAVEGSTNDTNIQVNILNYATDTTISLPTEIIPTADTTGI